MVIRALHFSTATATTTAITQLSKKATHFSHLHLQSRVLEHMNIAYIYLHKYAFKNKTQKNIYTLQCKRSFESDKKTYESVKENS